MALRSLLDEAAPAPGSRDPFALLAVQVPNSVISVWWSHLVAPFGRSRDYIVSIIETLE